MLSHTDAAESSRVILCPGNNPPLWHLYIYTIYITAHHFFKNLLLVFDLFQEYMVVYYRDLQPINDVAIAQCLS